MDLMSFFKTKEQHEEIQTEPCSSEAQLGVAEPGGDDGSFLLLLT